MTAMTQRLAASEDPDLAIVSISPQAQTAFTYVRGALFNPVSLSVMAFAVCVGVGYAGMFGALIAMMAFVALGTGATRYKYVRRQLDRQFEYCVRQKREADTHWYGWRCGICGERWRVDRHKAQTQRGVK